MSDEKSFSPVTTFDLKLKFPQIYPFTVLKPFIFKMRVQVVEEAEAIQKAFVMLPDGDRKAQRHKYNVDMISQLIVEAPKGFPDFPEPNGRPLGEVLHEYFIPEDSERRAGMEFIVRKVMSEYWSAITPADYL